MEEHKKNINVVCLIEMEDEQGNKYIDPGFLFGNGWVMTEAHNLQDGPEQNKSIHNFIRNAKYNVTRHVQTPDKPAAEYVFPI